MELNLPTGYYLAQLFFTGNAAPTGAAITFAGRDVGGSTSAAGIAGIIATTWGTNLDNETNSLLTLGTVRVKKGPMEDGPFGVVNTANTGNKAASAASPNVAYLVRKNTALGGKKGSGRLYMPGVAEADVNENGDLVAARLTALQSAWQNFHAALQTATVPMYLAHSHGTYVNTKGQTITVPAITPSEVTSLSLDNRVATQRRRLRR